MRTTTDIRNVRSLVLLLAVTAFALILVSCSVTTTPLMDSGPGEGSTPQQTPVTEYELDGYVGSGLSAACAFVQGTDTPLQGVTVTLLGQTASGQAVNQPSQTGTDGRFTFWIRDGNYTVSVPATHNGQSIACNSTNSTPYESVTLAASNGVVSDVVFGYEP